MKVGILTFHRAHNYGAVLQCYALQETLKGMGHQVEVIDYRPRYIEDAYKLSITSRLQTDSLGSFLKSVLREFMLLPTRFCRRKGFDSFIHNYLSLSREVIGTQIPNEYDVYVVGSDQIWNRAITDGYDNVFFCDFQFEKKGRKYISYAASTEQASMAESDISVFEDRLSVFDAVSVREDAFVDYLSRSSKHNIYREGQVVAREELKAHKIQHAKAGRVGNVGAAGRGDGIQLDAPCGVLAALNAAADLTRLQG